MPWRATRDPYKIWVSEIMLQQTRVDAVVPFYQRWMARFPTVTALAEAPLDDVLASWSGLGYYARARNLHVAARDVVERYAGRVPDDPDAIATLRGIGPYTAGAILSIAYGRAEPILDGNVARVLARIFVLDEPPGSALTKRLWNLARQLVPEDHASAFNQSMMELGATICTPTKPQCGDCPVADDCGALLQGRQSELPRPKKKPPVPVVPMVSLLIRSAERVWLMQRPTSGLWGGLWEPPSDARGTNETAEKAAQRIRHALGLAGTLTRLPPLVHILSHRRLEIQPFTIELDSRHKALTNNFGDYVTGRWVPLADLSAFGIAAWSKRLVAANAVPTLSR